MTYKSPFDDPRYMQFRHYFKHSDSLNNVLLDLEDVSFVDEKSLGERATLALHPSRIVRACVNYKIHNSGNEMILREGISTALDIYSNPEDVGQTVKSFRDKIISTGLDDMLDYEVRQEYDVVTWNATDNYRSKKTAKKLVSKMHGEDILFIALGHGGIAAGMDVFLQYCQETGSTHSNFHVVRYSRMKNCDQDPQVSNEEIESLKEFARNKLVVIFDEDVSSGQTIVGAGMYFSIIFNCRIDLATNLDDNGRLKDRFVHMAI